MLIRRLALVSILFVLLAAVTAEATGKAWRGNGFRFVLPEDYARATQRQSSELAGRVQSLLGATGLVQKQTKAHVRGWRYVDPVGQNGSADLVAIHYGGSKGAALELAVVRAGITTAIGERSDLRLGGVQEIALPLRGEAIEVRMLGIDEESGSRSLSLVIAQGGRGLVALALEAPEADMHALSVWEATRDSLFLERPTSEVPGWWLPAALAVGAALCLLLIVWILHRGRPSRNSLARASTAFVHRRTPMETFAPEPEPTPVSEPVPAEGLPPPPSAALPPAPPAAVPSQDEAVGLPAFLDGGASPESPTERILQNSQVRRSAPTGEAQFATSMDEALAQDGRKIAEGPTAPSTGLKIARNSDYLDS